MLDCERGMEPHIVCFFMVFSYMDEESSYQSAAYSCILAVLSLHSPTLLPILCSSHGSKEQLKFTTPHNLKNLVVIL